MPILRTRLIGREDERAAARALLIEDAAPLLTLTGPGGVGKTRLALAIAGDVAAHFADGVLWVDLAPLADPALVPAAAAAALGLRPAADTPIDDVLIGALHPRQTLLLLDNCEHLAEATADLVASLLARCPALQVLATSRAPLHLHAEQHLPVDPLPLPEDGASPSVVAQNEAVRLFAERTRAVRPAFALTEANGATVAALCRRLDGLPLAIELAAARGAVLSPQALLAQMSYRLQLLTHGARDLPARQRTMAATIAWSYDLLDPSAQALFRRLAVFVGEFSLEAAQALAGGAEGVNDGVLRRLTSLVDQHLVYRVDGPDDRVEPRFAMLETIREFGVQRLAAEGEEAETRTAHARYFLELVDALDAGVAPHVPGADRVLGRLDIEHPNLRAALNWFAERGATEEFVRLAGALHAFWLHYGYIHEGRQWLEQAVALGGGASAPARVWALVGLFAMLWNQQAEEAAAQALIEEAVALARESGDALCLGLATAYRSSVELRAQEFARAEQAMDEARAAFASLPPAPWIARNLTTIDYWGLAYNALLRGDITSAEAHSVAVLERQRMLEHEHDAPYPYANRPQTLLGHIARIRQDPAAALGHYQGALRDAARSAEVRDTVSALGGIAGTLAAVGRWAEAARVFGAIEAACERAGIGFAGYVFDWQRAIGLPEPWLQAGTSFGVATTLRSAVRKRDPQEPPPVPDPATAAHLWAHGRTVPLAKAIADALSVDLTVSVSLPPGALPVALPVDPFGLSPREREVLALLCQRLTDAEIGAALVISPRTASRHVANLFDKLGVSSRREAAALAASHGLA